jgi:hypothetical protein
MASPAVTDPPGELMYRLIGAGVVDLRAEEDDALLEQALVDIAGPVVAGDLSADLPADQ